MKAVIMCGGSGTRLWPMSRIKNPKQFVPFFGNKSLFELTIERNISLVDEFFIVVNEAQLPLCQSQVPKIIQDKVKYIIEPIGRNTAPAITLATLLAKDDDLLILASDHLIKNQSLYEECVHNAKRLAQNTNLVTFGITANDPVTGYGYIEADGNNVLSFKEKPDLNTAIEYVAAGNYFWNSGMFFFNGKTYLSELEKFSPEIYSKSIAALESAHIEGHIYKIQKNDMLAIPEDSIDYAVMEKSKNIKVIPSSFYWTDLGSYQSLYNELPKDELGNNINEKHFNLNSQNNLILSDKKIVCTFDVSDLIIAETDDALLVGKISSSQKVKEVLKLVKETHPDLN